MVQSRRYRICIVLAVVVVGITIISILTNMLKLDGRIHETLAERGELIADYLRETMNENNSPSNNISTLKNKRAQNPPTIIDDLTGLEHASLADTIKKMAENLTKIQESLRNQDKELAEKINEIRNINLESIDRLDMLSSKEGGAQPCQPTTSKKVLNRTLLILTGSIQDIEIRMHQEATHHQARMHRTLIFGGKGRNTSISDKHLFDDCQPGCEFTSNPARFNESDVVIFYAGNVAYNAVKKPLKRAFPEQKYVFFFFEQPHHFTPKLLTIMNEKIGINWTLHYQQDATVNWPYGQAQPRSTPYSPPIDFIQKKTRKVLWVVSNCVTTFARRENYVAELIKYIDIDVYGKCSESFQGYHKKMDVQGLASGYKFNIAFENGDCDDYVSEKFYKYTGNVLTVPIVLGKRNNYFQLAPANSYIHADQFDSPQQLAAYLHMLDKDSTLYLKYFEWRKTHTLVERPNPYCKMCETFREKWFEPSVINMHMYHGHQRCWKSGRSMPIYKWAERLHNYTITNPWEIINSLNSRDKPLRFS